MSKSVQVLEAIQARWAGGATLTGLVPGGLHQGRRTKPTTRPYATVEVIEGEPLQEGSGRYVVQPYTATIRVYSQGGATPSSVPKQVQAALGTAYQQPLSMSLSSGCRCMTPTPKPGSLAQDQATNDAEDVLVTSSQWEFTIQYTR